MKIAYLGNFGPPFSTETHVALSLESLGHEVLRIQEGAIGAVDVPVIANTTDLFLWTQTHSLAERGGTLQERAQMLAEIAVPTVGFHLDRWWGLDREVQVAQEPFFRVDRLFTADGGHDDRWRDAGIDHTWSPPAVFHGEAIDVPARGRSRAVVFVGAWRSYGHAEWWPARRDMLEAVRRRYGQRFHCLPRGVAIRGLELNALYASTKVVVGDSCLAGGATRYWSDRLTETLGRGGFLIHPYVQGLDEEFIDGKHLVLYEVGNHRELLRLIEHYLRHDAERERIRVAGAAHVRAHHTYRDRMRRMLEVPGT